MNFKTEWTPEDFKTIDKQIVAHFRNKNFETLHGQVKHLRTFDQIDYKLGLAFTNTSDYAMYSVCNTEVYYNPLQTQYFNHFAISESGECYAIIYDREENETYEPLKETKAPLMYNGWLIERKETPHQGKKFSAYNFATDKFINPLYNTWEQLKSVIDAMKFPTACR